MKFFIVASRFNESIVKALHQGALVEFDKHGFGPDAVITKWVPGAFEIPTVAAVAARSGKYNAIICLGAVIRGETAHFDFVAGECARAIMNIGVDTGVPTIFGVLTTENVDQARARAGLTESDSRRVVDSRDQSTKSLGANDNHGCYAARAAIEMVALMSDAVSR